ncbi:mechanosensitive ion channel family protein [Haloarchaeobius amylolyticus]|uniref:mechanosensitive ion channel family protein n=1 Tax=Haloarchaeobius amylolyticus TaxID=1198296 RepID=UPI00226ED992|nr:mechanosensitive ion channel family protein [Haloarchaeobius amylolyticus]
MPGGAAVEQDGTNTSTTTAGAETTTGQPGGAGGGPAGTTTAEEANGVDAISDVLAGQLDQLVPPWFPSQELVNLLLAVAIITFAWYASKLVVRLLGRTIAQRLQRPSVTRTALRMVRIAVMGIAFTIVAPLLGLQFGDILLSVTVFSAVLGIVLAPIVGSIINGVFVLADQPYEIGDMIKLADRDTTGFVEDITIRYTKIFTLDNTFLVIDNSSIRGRDVVNYSAEDERTRLSLSITVTYEGDLDEARELIEDAAKEVDMVIPGGPDIRIGSARYPAAPTCYIDQYADHGVMLTLRYWAKQPYKLLTVRSRVQENVWAKLEDADVEIAYPHSHVVFDETSGELPISMREGETRRAGPGGVRPGEAGPASGVDREEE